MNKTNEPWTDFYADPLGNIKIFCGDCLKVLPRIASDSIPLIITSPPYWNTRCYGDLPGEIGFRQDYPEFLRSLEEVWGECERILKPGGRVVVNIGEIFFREDAESLITYTSIFVDIILAFRKLKGMVFNGKLLWVKGTGINYSYMRSGKGLYGSYPYPPNLLVANTPENLLVFRKRGNDNQRPERIKERSKVDKKFISKFTCPVWFISPARDKRLGALESHPAVFPLEIAERFVRAFSFWDDVILDPFAGRGTALMAALKWGRKAIGIDINPKNFNLMRYNTAPIKMEVNS